MGIGVGTGLAGIGAIWGWVLPSIVESRAEDALERRLGMEAHVGDVDVGLTSAQLEEVTLRGRHGGIEVELGEVDAHVGLGALLTGSLHIDRVAARDVRVELDLTDGAARRSLEEIRKAWSGRREEGAGEGETGGGDRHLRVDGLELRARDARGGELELRDATALYEDGRALGRAAEVRLTSTTGHRVRLTDPSGEVVRRDQGWELASLGAEGGTVVLRQHTPEGSAQEADDGSDDAGDAEEPDSPSAPSPNPDATRPGTSTWAERMAMVVERLAPRADIQLADITIRSMAGGRERTILEGLRLGIQADGPRVFRSSGSGRAAGGGELGWDVTVHPEEVRAEGTLRFEGLPLALVAPILPDVPWHEPEKARLDGKLELRAESPESLAVEGRVALVDAALASPRIAPEPVPGINLLVEGEGHWVPDDRRLEIASARIASGRAHVRLAGMVEWAPEHYAVQLTAHMPSIPCGEAIGAIPPDFLGWTSRFAWDGHLAGHLEVQVDSRDLADTELDIRVADGCQFTRVPRMADVGRFRGVFQHQVEEPDGTVFEMTTGPGSGNWQPVRTVSPFLVHAVLAHEDAAFFRHHGFAPWAIEEALARNLEEGRYVVGASTITMQLAKNLFLRREKTLARKVQEVILTWWLESALDKGDILELYLNVIEYGPGVYGIQNGAWHYFGRPPSDLTPAESAFLATILPNPKVYGEQHRRGELSASTANRMRRLLRHMAAKGRIDQAALDHGLAEIGSFDFHHQGEPPPEPAAISGEAAPLPLGIADEHPGRAPHTGEWEDIFEADAAPEEEDPFRELPQVQTEGF